MDFDFSTETITPDTTNLLTIGGTGGLEVPFGTTAQRPVTGLVNGTMRYNSDLNIVETYSNSSWTSAVNPGTITSVSGSGGATGLTLTGGPITSTGTLTLGGILAPASGGTGTNTSTAANGQLLIGNGTGLTLNTLTAGTAISITNGSGTITIANTGVTSNVAGAGISVSGATGAVTITNTGVTSAIGTAGNITVSAATGAVTFNLATAGTAVSNQFVKITTDAFGRVTATSAVASGDITTALGYTPVNKAGDSMSGTLTMTGGSTQVVLPNSPVAGTDAANKNYVDAAIAGLSWKQAVRAATTVTGTLATAFANGQTIDGVTLATNDRILIKNQSTQTENGIYIVQATGAPVRSSDADTGAELVGASVYVDQGTVNADSGWVQVTNAPITIGASNIVFTQFSGSGAYTAGTGLTLTGNTFSLTSPVLATLGGTGQTVYAVGDLLAANTTTTLSRVADVVTGNALISGGVSTLPLWGKIGLTTHVSGILPIANGGTNLATTPTNGQLLIGNGAGYTLATIAGTAGNVTVTNGSGTITLNLATAGSAGTYGAVTTDTFGRVTSGNAVNPIANGGTGLSTLGTANQILGVNAGATALEYKTVTAGTAISVVNAAGSITINNTGVTSLAGTANQITASAATGAVTLSTPATFIAPGSITATTTMTVSGLTANSFLYSGTAGLLTTTAAPTNGQLLIGSTGAAPSLSTLTAGTGISVTNAAGSITIAATGGTGTVTSVALALPSFITVTGSPVTTSGTLTGTLATQTANTVFAGPTTGGAVAPTFRALVAADVLNTTAIQLYRETASTPTTPVASGNNSVAIGSGSSATGVNAFAVGAGTAANVDNVSVYANGNFATAGDAQNIVVMLRNSTTDATATELFINGSSQRLVLPNNSAWTVNIRVAGRRTDATGGWALFTFVSGVTRDAAANTTTLQSSSRTIIDRSSGSLNCTLAADTTNGSLNITVTGLAAQTFRWVATAEITQVTN